MQYLTLDFETYYDKDYSLSKKGMTTQAYIMSPKFEVLMASVKWGDGETQVVEAPDLPAFFASVDWVQTAVVNHNCLTGDHEVRTTDGWVRLDALRGGEKILQWNSLTGKGEFVDYIPVCKDYNGNIYTYNTIYHKGVYTSEHRMYYATKNNSNWKVAPVAEVNNRHPNGVYIPTAVSCDGSNTLFTADEVRILEAVRADATFSSMRTAIFHFCKADKISRIQLLSDKCGLDVRCTKTDEPGMKQQRYVVRVSGELISRIWQLIGKKKLLADWVTTLPLDVRRAWVDEMPYWDAVQTSSCLCILHTASRNNAEWLYEMALLSGFTVSAKFDHPNTRGFSRPDGVIHHLRINKKQRAKLVTRAEVSNYSGKVYCVSVPSGAFVVRRKGATWITGNCLFDLSILWWRYGYRPALAVDTMSLAQCLGVPLLTGSASLAKCVQLLQEAGYELPSKGGEVVNALGKHRKDFTPAQWEAYKQYCKTDADITWFLFKVLKQYVSDDELAYQDIILRCYTEPRLKVHVPTVEYELARCRAYKAEQLAKVCEQLGCTQDNLAGVLRSNDKFAALLKAMGGITEAEMEQGAQGSFIIPTKVSATTGKVTWAFGKTDVGFKELCENELPFVQAICQARLAAKSSIDETRCEKFLDYASYGFLPMGYKIGGAHTNRMSGGSAGSANMQNLPSGRREGQSDLLRRSIIANDGQVIVNYDASQIECRVLNYIANQTDVLGVFASKGDVYSYTAAGVYGIPYSEINEGRKSSSPEIAAKYKPIRNYGKTCALALGYGQGAAGFQKYALVNSGINMSLDEAKRTVTAWRKANYAAAGFWKTCDQALQVMVDGGQMYFGGQDGKMFFADGKRFLLGRHVPGIRMPNGLWLNYPNLHVDMSSGKPQFVYDKVGYTGKPLKSKAYGGLICENIVQSLAFAIMKQQALWIAKYYPIVMNTHDEWCVVVPRDQAETAAEYMARCMRTAPDYVAGLPLDTEGGWAQSYGAVDDDWSKRPDNPDRVHRFDPNTGDVL